MAKSKNGTAVVAKPEHYGVDVPDAVALIFLYGPNGGDRGSASIDATNAREVIARLTAALERAER
jgi:hypothetical protein